MLKDTVPFERIWLETHGPSRPARAILSFIRFIEQRLGAEFLYDTARIGHESIDLVPVFELAETLRAHGIISGYGKSPQTPDNPHIAHWFAQHNAGGVEKFSSGISFKDNKLAFLIALAEALERHVWFECTDQFPPLRSASMAEVSTHTGYVRPDRFAGYNTSQRKNHSSLQYGPSSILTWVKGYSWVNETEIWLPAQIISGHATLHALKSPPTEPVIRPSLTTGIAVHPQRTNALLSGALEVIERDAYMIMWLNQLSLPRMDLEELSKRSQSLKTLVAYCRRYRLEPHAIRLISDAPTYAVCVVLEDTTETLPRFVLGLKAHRDPAYAVERALLEALGSRSRRTPVTALSSDWSPEHIAELTPQNRLLYWAKKEHADHLAFLTKGKVVHLEKGIWETDTDEEHFKRITAWCRERGYELVSVSHTGTKANVLHWHIESIVIPELQPMHLFEKLPCAGGARLHDIPVRFGYTPRDPYIEEPHPFA